MVEKLDREYIIIAERMHFETCNQAHNQDQCSNFGDLQFVMRIFITKLIQEYAFKYMVKISLSNQ